MWWMTFFSIRSIADFCEGNEALGPQQILDADFRGSFEHPEGELSAQNLAGGDGWRPPCLSRRPTLAECGLQVGQALVAVLGIVFARANGGALLADTGLVLADSGV